MERKRESGSAIRNEYLTFQKFRPAAAYPLIFETEVSMITESRKNETLERLMTLRSDIEKRIAELERLEQASKDEEETAKIYDTRMYLIIAFENIVLGIKELLG